jgi:hypothetical protein
MDRKVTELEKKHTKAAPVRTAKTAISSTKTPARTANTANSAARGNSRA